LDITQYHPVVIEGMGSYDKRDPHPIARQVTEQLLKHWLKKPPKKPLLVLTQGDPREPSGIAAITPQVALNLGVQRGLVYLDEDISDQHGSHADRDGVMLEMKYSYLVSELTKAMPHCMRLLESAIDQQILKKNDQRAKLGKGPLKDYFRDFALLQEVTKAFCSQHCAGVTIIHTSTNISEFSVTSFYTVGVALGLVDPANMVTYSERQRAP
jgi:hypothetical protein